MGLFSIKGKSETSATIVSDLDALVADPIAFRLHGRVFTIKPISTLELLKFTNAFSKLQNLQEKTEALTVSQLVDAYYEIISSVCPEIEKKHIEEMTQTQVSALFQLVLDTVVGKAHAAPNVGDESKKKPLNQA